MKRSKIRIRLGCFTLIWAATSIVPARADSFAEVQERWKQLGVPILESALQGDFSSRDGARLHYTIFFPEAQGIPVVVSPGMGETGTFYTETAWALRQEGYGPIYILDHRGNGLSERLHLQTDTVHLEDFQVHLTDFTQFLSQIVVPHRTNFRAPSAQPLLVAHSLGAAIAVSALADHSQWQKYFSGLVVFSPMFKINLRYKLKLPLIERWFEWISLELNFADQLPAENFLRIFRYWRPDQQVIGQGPVSEDFVPDNNVTHSEGHWRLLRLVEDYLGTPLLIKAVTNAWVFEGMKLARYARNRLDQITLPILATEAGQDTLVRGEPIRDLQRHRTSPVTYLNIEGSRHATHLENRPIRERLWREIARFGLEVQSK